MTTEQSWDELRELAMIANENDLREYRAAERRAELNALSAAPTPERKRGQEQLSAFSLHPGWSWPTARPSRTET